MFRADQICLMSFFQVLSTQYPPTLWPLSSIRCLLFGLLSPVCCPSLGRRVMRPDQEPRTRAYPSDGSRLRIDPELVIEVRDDIEDVNISPPNCGPGTAHDAACRFKTMCYPRAHFEQQSRSCFPHKRQSFQITVKFFSAFSSINRPIYLRIICLRT